MKQHWSCRKDSRPAYLLSIEKEFSQVIDLSLLTDVLDAFLLPLLGGFVLFLAKFTHGEAARWAEKQFYAALVVITLVTVRTVIVCDESWLLHTSTLGVMIVGALVVPSQDAAMAL